MVANLHLELIYYKVIKVQKRPFVYPQLVDCNLQKAK